MPNNQIEEFSKILIEKVRDTAIKGCDMQLDPDAKGPTAKRWREIISKENPETVARALIPDIVDSALEHLLDAVDQGLLRLSYKDSDGKITNLTEDGLGELCGWYMGSDGWCATHSKERYVNDFADLEDFKFDSE